MIQHRPLPLAPPSSVRSPHRFVTPPAGIPAPRSAPSGLPQPPHSAPARPLPHLGPPVPEIRIRPRLVWVGLAWLLFAVLVLIGVGTVVGASAGSGPRQFFAAGEVATLDLEPGAEHLIYTALDAGGYVRCRPVGPRADFLKLTPVTTERSVVVDGREWHAAFDVDPAAAGRYQIMCDGPRASFAAGGQAGSATGAGAAVTLLALPLVGLAGAVSTTAVVLIRRRAEQERLFAQWTGRGW